MTDFDLSKEPQLTKRQYIAAMVLQGILAHPHRGGFGSDEYYAGTAVRLADAILKLTEE